jgi:hypothetical protein
MPEAKGYELNFSMRMKLHTKLIAEPASAYVLRAESDEDPMLRWWTDYVWAHWTANNSTGMVDDTGTTRTGHYHTPHSCLGPSGASNYGPLLGSGTNAVQITNYALQTKIVHGSGSGQLYHLQTYCPYQPTLSGSTYKFEVFRDFLNLFSGAISVNEVAMYVNYSVYNYCFARDVLGSTVAVPVRGTARLTYTMSITV